MVIGIIMWLINMRLSPIFRRTKGSFFGRILFFLQRSCTLAFIWRFGKDKEAMETQIRKSEINLGILGPGITVFGIWLIVKYLFLSPVYEQTLSKYSAEFDIKSLTALIWIEIIVEVLLRFYIGFSAQAESKGKRLRGVYLIVTAVTVAVSTAFIIGEIIFFILYGDSLVAAFITIVIDVTSTLLLLEVLIYGYRLRRFRKQLAGEILPHES